MNEHKDGALIGYARVSTDRQNLALQIDALNAAACDRVYEDVGSRSLKHRPDLDAALDYVRPGDMLVVWRLDRLGRGLRHLIDVVGQFEERGIGFRSQTEQIDPTTPGGRLTFHLFASLAEFEREVLRERARTGLAAARARGRLGGRPRSLTPEQVQRAREMRAQGDQSMTSIAKTFGVGRTTLYRHLDTGNGRDQAA